MDVDEDFERFVSELVTELAKHWEDSDIIRSEDGNHLSLGRYKANLRSLFRNYVAETEDGIERITATILETVQQNVDDATPPWDSVKETLRPKLWDRMAMASNDCGMPFKLVGEHLMLSIVQDQTYSMRIIPRSMLDEWGVSFDEALKVAFDNVAPSSQFMGVKSNDGLSGHCSTATHDSYDNVRCLIETPYEQFQIGYPRFAFPSARDMCVMAMANRPEDLEFCIEMALDFGDEDPKPLPPFPLVNEGDGWRNWQAPTGSKIYRMLARRQFAYLFNGYAHQTHVLMDQSAEQGDFVLIESFKRWPGSSDELPKSYCNWSADTETLLPTTDCVVFPDRNSLRVAWSDLVTVCGEKLVPSEACYPARWRTDGYPSDEEFDRLESMSLD